MITLRLLWTILATGSLMITPVAIAEAPKPQPAKTVLFSGGAQPIYRLRDPSAVVWDQDGKPVFQGDDTFIKRYAANSTGRVFEWDPVGRRIRISTKRPAWLSCDAVEELAIACSNLQFVPADNGGIVVSLMDAGSVRGGNTTSALPATALRGVPNCPGDVRCPKL